MLPPSSRYKSPFKTSICIYQTMGFYSACLLGLFVDVEDGGSSSSETSVNIYQTIGFYSACLLGLLLDPEDGGCTFSETSVNFCQSTRHHIPEDSILQ
jgi:hypothetical protein